MKGYLADIETLTEENIDFRKARYTGHNLQLVLMAPTPGLDIGIDGVRHKIKGGGGRIVPAGAKHDLVNTGDKLLRLFTIYGPPNHIDKLVEKTKAEAEPSGEVFDGVASD